MLVGVMVHTCNPAWDMESGHLQWIFSQSASKHVMFQASLDYGVKTLSQQNTHTQISKTQSKTNVSTEQRENKTESKKKKSAIPVSKAEGLAIF